MYEYITGLDAYAGYQTIIGADGQPAAVVPLAALPSAPPGMQSVSMVQRGFAPMGAPSRPYQGPRIQESAGTHAGEEPIGVPSTLIPKSSTLPITTRPEYTFRPSRFVVPASIAANFLINDIRIANQSVFQNAVPVPAETFTQVAVGVALALRTCSLGQSIVVEVTNTDAAADHTFFATFIGTTIK